MKDDVPDDRKRVGIIHRAAAHPLFEPRLAIPIGTNVSFASFGGITRLTRRCPTRDHR